MLHLPLPFSHCLLFSSVGLKVRQRKDWPEAGGCNAFTSLDLWDVIVLSIPTAPTNLATIVAMASQG